MNLYDPLTVLPRVGPVRAEKLAQAGLRTVEDVLRQFPRMFENRKRCLVAHASADHTSIVEVMVNRAAFLGFGGRKRLEVATTDPSSALKLVFFNPQRINVKDQFSPNQRIVAVGKIERFNGTVQMVHPKIFSVDKISELEGIFPIYPQIKGISSNELGTHVRSALAYLNKSHVNDPFDRTWLHQHHLATIPEAYHVIHDARFQGHNQRIMSLRRFAFEEVFSVQLSLLSRQEKEAQRSGYKIQSECATALFKSLLPFEPTKAQVKALSDLFADMTSTRPMARLLQGDVGSGKTAVCATAALLCVKSGFQSALMAPTDILVEQHLANFKKWFSPLGYRVEKLTGNQKESEKRKILADLISGDIHVVVGTQALLTQNVAFKRLALCIIDEQHRFGVDQRRLFKQKGESSGRVPHLLAMTATPIPRSLALTLYGDMSLSVIDELPPGRTKVATQVIRGSGLALASRLCSKMIRENAQAYIIFPLVEESEKLDLRNAVEAYQSLCAQFGGEHIALVHGKMKAQEKDAAMSRFAQGFARVLISTTVVEVGVDVPNATFMLIVNAERFGLSQLHQLRGRVGRGKKESFCYLALENESSENARRRLDMMAKTNDGFEIAAEDLAIRGPGELLGARQSGLDSFVYFDFSKHGDLVELARQKAKDHITKDPSLREDWLQPFLDKSKRFLNC